VCWKKAADMLRRIEPKEKKKKLGQKPLCSFSLLFDTKEEGKNPR